MEDDEHPWNVQIYEVVDNDKKIPLCVGALISKTHVLTANICFKKEVKRRIQCPGGPALLPCYDWVTLLIEAAQLAVAVGSETSFPILPTKWFDAAITKASEVHDFAIVTLKEPVDFQRGVVTPICLPENPSQNYDGKAATTIGYGYKDRTEQNYHPRKLKSKDQELFDKDRCLKKAFASVIKAKIPLTSWDGSIIYNLQRFDTSDPYLMPSILFVDQSN